MEWNALTYAGHTVWNVHNEYRAPRRGQDLQRVAGGYIGGVKRRPRAEWQLQRDTHAALITDDEAERILAALERSPFKPTRRTTATALLTGLLKTPDGTPWYSDNGGKHYRVGKKGQGRKVQARLVDEVILRRVTADLVSPRFVAAAYAATMKHYKRGMGRNWRSCARRTCSCRSARAASWTWRPSSRRRRRCCGR
jgi:site-specific DNA recombinase